MPPGQEPIPSAQTSVPAAGRMGSPVKMMSRKTVPCKNTSKSAVTCLAAGVPSIA